MARIFVIALISMAVYAAPVMADDTPMTKAQLAGYIAGRLDEALYADNAAPLVSCDDQGCRIIVR